MTLAAIRPDEWNLPLLLHVTGAMVLVGALATVLATLVVSRRGDTAALTRLGYRTLLFAGLPAFVLMRGTAEWIRSEEDAPDDSAWIGIGYMTSDAGLLILVAATVLAGVGARRLTRGTDASGLSRVASVLLGIALVGYAVAVWAMTTKPD